MANSIRECTALAISEVGLMLNTIFLFWMQLEFVVLYAGLARSVDRVHIYAKAASNIAVGAIAWWAFSWDLYQNGQLEGVTLHDHARGIAWLHDFALFGTTLAIFLGATGSRVPPKAHLLFIVLIIALARGVIHATRFSDGFLTGLGFRDANGAAGIHFFGGTISLVWASHLGLRIGNTANRAPRYGNLTREELSAVRSLYSRDHRGPIASLMGLHVSWTAATTGDIMATNPAAAGLVAFHTILGASIAGCVGMLASRVVRGHVYATTTFMAALTGILAISGGTHLIATRDVVVTATIAPFLVLYLHSWLMRQTCIEDVGGIISVHLVGGFVGTLLPGLLAKPTESVCLSIDTEASLIKEGSFAFLGAQLAGLSFIGLCAALPTLLFIFLCRRFGILLHFKPIREAVGQDIFCHGASVFSALNLKRVTLEVLHKALTESMVSTHLHSISSTGMTGVAPRAAH